MTHMEKIKTDSDLCNYTVNEEMLEKEGIINRTSPASEKKKQKKNYTQKNRGQHSACSNPYLALYYKYLHWG